MNLSPNSSETFYQSASSDLIHLCYSMAPATIQTALREEIAFLRSNIHSDDRLLELGCGSGRVATQLAGHVRQFVGIDRVHSYLTQAPSDFQGREKFICACAQADRLPFGDQQFDQVICVQNTFGQFGSKQVAVLAEGRRVVKTFGKIVLVVYNQGSIEARLEWYAALHSKGAMGAVPPENILEDRIISEDGHNSEHFSLQRLEALFSQANLKSKMMPLGQIYWACVAGVTNLN